MVAFLRAVLANTVFYGNTIFWMLVLIPFFALPRLWGMKVVFLWAKTCRILMKGVAGIDWTIEGLEHLPEGGFILAAKHQSAWETFGLMPLVRDPVFILKRELMWIPLFGWYLAKFRMIPVDRGKGGKALRAMAQAAIKAMREGRQLIIFPEGTRRPVDAEPHYKYGVATIYSLLNVPVVPVALNSGLYWPRRKMQRHAGLITVKIMEPIAPGMDRDGFLKLLEERIETATDTLVEESRARYFS